MSTKTRRVTEDDQYVAMMQRMIRGLERRAIEDPQLLAHVLMLAQQLGEVTNVVIHESAERYQANPFSSPSAGEIARLLGMSKQAASKRRERGREIAAARLSAAGAVSFAAARAEKAARQRAAAHARQAMPTWAERRAQMRAV